MRRSISSVLVLIIFIFIVVGTSVSAHAAGPIILQLVPTSAPVGGVLSISGSGFGATQGSSTVTVNGIPVTVISFWSGGNISAEIPVGATTGNVVVKVGGVSSSGKSLTIVPAPAISSISPSSGPIGTPVTITGTNLMPSGVSSPPPAVCFLPTGGSCGIETSPTTSTNTSYTFTVPAGAVPGKVSAQYDGVESNPVTFTVTGTLAPVADAGLNSIVSVGSSVRLDGTHSYDLNGLPITYQWAFASVPSGSTAALVNPTTAQPTFVPDVVGEYLLQLTTSNGTVSNPNGNVAIDTPSYGYTNPRASAGPDQTTHVGATVQLDGSGSTSPSGTQISSFQWCLWYAVNDSSQPTYQGIASFSNSHIVNPTFVATNAGNYFAVLWVGGTGGCDVEVNPLSPGPRPNADFVKISTSNSQPVANAGPDQSIQAPQTVQLDGTGSTDVDGNALTYSWTIVSKPAGSTATLTGPTTPQPTLNLDVLGTYVAQLIVNDGTVSSLPGVSFDPINRTSTVTITSGDVTPIADAGPGETVAVGSSVSLDGTASSDVDGHVLSYRWALISKPSGSAATLQLPTSPVPYFTADIAGKYVAQLIVNDGIADSVPSTVVISTDNSVPIADAGPHQTAVPGSTVQLSGAESSDADGNVLTYRWAILYHPAGANAVLANPTTVDPTFVASIAGLYVVQLIVNDGKVDSAPVTTWIKTQTNQAPIVSAGPNQAITLPLNRVTLFGTATDDGLPNGTLTMSWTQVSGPGTTAFSSPSTAVTDALFSAPGVYVLKLTANDSQLNSSSTTTITVNAGALTILLTPTQSQVVTVPGSAGPWVVSGTLNSAYSYGNAGSGPPVVVPAKPGQQMTLQYVSGLVSIGNGFGAFDGIGLPGGNGNVAPHPAFYAAGPSNGGCLMGAWADATGQLVAAPFIVNDGGTFIAPPGAAQLQLGVNDDVTYGDNTGSWSVKIQNGVQGLSSSVGPDVTGTSQTLTAAVTQGGTPIAGLAVQFTVTGPNATTGSGTTNAGGVATFTYTGSHVGTDAVQASSGSIASNSVSVTWITPVQSVSIGTALGKFFQSDGSCAFNTSPTATPAFTQEFPTIAFNAPSGVIAGNTSGVTINTRPLTDITTDTNGNYTGTIVAQGNSLQAGVGALASFQAVFAGSFTVASAGNVTLNLFDDDGFILGIGGGAGRVSGPLVAAPASGATPFNNLRVVGAYNQVTTGGPVGNVVVVNFPAAGTYPYELDYTECNSGQLAMTMALGATNSTGAPPTGSLVITPNNPAPLTVGQVQTLTVQAKDGSGAVLPNLGVNLSVYGANQQLLNATTNSSGQATFQYSSVSAGQDSVQALANVSGMATVSNAVQVTWNPQSGGGTTYVFTPQGWIGTPAIGTTVQGQVAITLASGITLTSGTLKFFPTSNPSNVTVLNSNTTGTGPLTLGTFDATLLANGQYTVQLQSVSSTGAAQLNEIVLSVTGESKPGREIVSVTDLKIPLAGIPIEITRTYDSLNRGTVEDFGNGWKLGTSVELSVDLLMNVTFTINGKRQTFSFTPQSAGSFLFPWLGLPHYTPQPGLFGALTSNGCSPLAFVGGALVQDQAGVACFPGGTYLPTIYTYTDPVGRVYTITSTGQLQTIKDLNGNTLTFAPTGITSSAGNVVVPFVRDAQNRITQITDLNGNNYVYGYDGNGDLHTVTFPGVNSPAVYTYTNHRLQTQQDPNGNTTTSAFYPDGRLQTVTGPSVTGGNGSPTQYVTQYAYNIPANSTTVTYPDTGIVTTTYDVMGKPLNITDALNRTTTYFYDARENPLTATDALQKTTTYTYDANGFRTSVMDPLQHKTTQTNNQFGGVTSTTDATQLNTVTFSYDAFFNPVSASDLIGQLYAGTFDTSGNLLTRTDAAGNTTQLTYDAQGNIVKVVDPLNEVTTITYDAMNRVASRTDPRGDQTTFNYDALGDLTDTMDAVGHVSRSTYDLNGNKTADIDALGRTTSYTYDALNRLAKITYPDNATRTYIYDFRNNKLSETDQSGRVTQYQYDLAGQLKNVTYALGTIDVGTVQYTYDNDGRTKTVTDELSNVTTYNYYDDGQLQSIVDANQKTTTYTNDADHFRKSVQDANNHTTNYAPDARHRLQTITYPDTPTTTTKYTYDGMGRPLTITDQANIVTTRAYDAVGRLKSVTDAQTPTHGVTQYAYDTAGNLTLIADANNHKTSFQYDSLNQRVLRALPVGMVETQAYDAVGNISAKTSFNGKTTIYIYDSLRRLLKKIPDPSLSQPTITYTYYPTGTRQTMADATGTTNYTYDNRDRLKTKATPEGTINYTYDAHSNLKTIASSNTNGASVTYGYDVLNHLHTVDDNRLHLQGATSYTTTYNYDPVSNLLNYTLPNGVVTSNTFDPLNRLASTGSTKGATLSSYTITPFPAGNVHTVAELGGRSVTYGYDNIYRLTSEAITADPGGNNGTVAYPSYDQVGNRIQRTSTLSAVPPASYSYDANDRLATDAYDNNGNTIFSGGIAFTYDFENRLLSRGAASIVYDGDGNRVSETAAGTTTKYLVDDKNPTGYSQVMDEVVNGSVTRTYAYGLQRIDENQLIGGTWTPSFYGYDGHGNARFLANAAGTVTDNYTFDAFGSQIASSGTTPNAYLYSGERFDSNLNLYHLRARYYNQLTGRFFSLDPYQGRILDPATLHKYVYAQNDPVDEIDPAGRAVIVEVAFIYVRFDVSAPAPKVPWWKMFLENNEELPIFAYERLHNFAFARDIGRCDMQALQQTAAVIGGGPGGPDTGNELLQCLTDAFKEELSPVPFLPFPL